MNVREHVLDEARRAVSGGRDLQHGTPEDSFTRIALQWRVWLAIRFGVELDLEPWDVACMMIDVKKARIAVDPQHLDSWIDVAGYGACGADVAGSTPERDADARAGFGGEMCVCGRFRAQHACCGACASFRPVHVEDETQEADE